MRRYNPTEIEPKWQQKWQDDKTFYVDINDKPKKFIIDMFPYPSGAAMHVGHVRNFTISDVLSQYYRQKGFNVMHTMGWDTFGLPAENYAIKTGTPPAETTKVNIANFKNQLNMLGMSYDWSREINTSDPEYYRWTQWIFTKLFERGLAYQAERAQWWCETDKTVLANEQVEAGNCWRCGNPVVKKSLKQWFFKITDYADPLLDGIDTLEWPTKIKTMQRNWIGKSVGAEIRWQVCDREGNETGVEVVTFTTRKDTIPGVTFVVVAPEYEALDDITAADHKARVHSYRTTAMTLSEVERQESKDKSGVFTGMYAKNPFNQSVVPIYVADYVLSGYGTGVVMGMGGHDERDREFSLKHDIPVILTTEVPEEYSDLKSTKVWSAKTGKQINSGEPYDGMENSEAGKLIFEKLVKDGKATAQTNYKMRDWLISRQRYWGAPIPIIHCEKHGAVAVPEDQLPVLLPEVESYEPTGKGSALAGATDWVNTTCPTCGGPAKRETDTMDGYACSSWYFLRYIDPKNSDRAWDPEKANYWLPVDFYCGGDHAVSHLLYTRFWFHVFADMGLIDEKLKEPVGKLVYNGYILSHDGTKMSKSKGNVINPDDLITQGYGADSVRLFEMFIAPYELNTNWNTNGVPGTYRFLQRFWNLVQEFSAVDHDEAENPAVLRVAHQAIKSVTNDLDRLSFNTAVASLMEALNAFYKLKAENNFTGSLSWQFALESFTQLLAPFASHISEEVWSDFGHEQSVHLSSWPEHDESKLMSDTLTIAIQINGKVRAELEVASDTSKVELEKRALSHDRIIEFTKGAEPKRVIVVPGKIVNIVV